MHNPNNPGPMIPIKFGLNSDQISLVRNMTEIMGDLPHLSLTFGREWGKVIATYTVGKLEISLTEEEMYLWINRTSELMLKKTLREIAL